MRQSVPSTTNWYSSNSKGSTNHGNDMTWYTMWEVILELSNCASNAY